MRGLTHDIESAVAEAIKTYAAAPPAPVALAAGVPDAVALARMIDHTLLKPEATPGDVGRLCEEAAAHGFYAVCVAASYARLARRALAGTGVRVATVVGFPHGDGHTAAKLGEARAVTGHADEIDTVVHLGALRAGAYGYLHREWSALKRRFPGTVKVILETGVLSTPEKIAACAVARLAGVDFVKTCTGFLPGHATPEDVALMKRAFGGAVKASGGIRSLAQARALIQAGADRLGTSASLNLVRERETQAP